MTFIQQLIAVQKLLPPSEGWVCKARLYGDRIRMAHPTEGVRVLCVTKKGDVRLAKPTRG